ncbi:MAG TPA: calcium-binding protein [Crinalium sp.]|jgi:Ca2+-binding RTX toxin-like protein
MSEVLVLPPGTSEGNPIFGLEILSDLPVKLTRDTPSGAVTAIGSSINDIIEGFSASLTTNLSILGDAGNDRLIGAAGRDNIFGGLGDDVIAGRGGNDSISGDAGSDRLRGGGGNDTVMGGMGPDQLFGEAGSDTLIGGTGDDIIDPGAGYDVMRGGEGRDTFRFGRGSTGGPRIAQRDQIRDFNPDDDTIALSRSLLPSSGIRPGKLKAGDFANVDKLTSGVSAKIVYERTTGLVYYNSPSGKDVPLIQLQKNLTVSAADFEIF